jgi:hypothetical protein
MAVFHNVYDAIYGGASLVNEAPVQAHSASPDWSPESWNGSAQASDAGSFRI